MLLTFTNFFYIYSDNSSCRTSGLGLVHELTPFDFAGARGQETANTAHRACASSVRPGTLPMRYPALKPDSPRTHKRFLIAWVLQYLPQWSYSSGGSTYSSRRGTRLCFMIMRAQLFQRRIASSFPGGCIDSAFSKCAIASLSQSYA